MRHCIRQARRKQPESVRDDFCPRCGSTRLFEVECGPGSPHYRRLGCSGCGRHVRYLPRPWTLERARAFTLPFGRHRGRTVGELADDPRGRSYLRWLAENTEGNPAEAATVALASDPPAEKGGR